MTSILQSRRADATMWWIIIGAVIALLVLVILIVLFTGKTNLLEAGLSDCEGKGGICAASGECPRSTLENGAFDCGNAAGGDAKVCCLGVPVECKTVGTDPVCTQKSADSQCVQFSAKKMYCT
ncbi:hypothetical protein HYV86_05970 [Candidatus Woesearchaeota archaeon]|nr:hypothetical protein [Candidatus Woesearchaeota archaeon]